MTDAEALPAELAAVVATVGGVVGVTLGGSRAHGPGPVPGADWDLGVYYRGALDVAGLRAAAAAAGWAGTVFDTGAWGGGIMDGGAWLTVGGEAVDLIYRDLDRVEHWWAEAEAGRFEKELLPFHLAGIPTYVVVGELALGRVLWGDLPRPRFPDRLAAEAPPRWRADALHSLAYAEAAWARRGDATVVTGNLARAVVEAAHGRLAATRAWALNEKGLAAAAGLDHVAAALLGEGPGAALALLRSELGPGGGRDDPTTGR